MPGSRWTRAWIGPVVAAALVLASSVAVPAGADADPAKARRRLVQALEADLATDPAIPGEVVAVRAPGLDVSAAAGLADRAGAVELRPETPFRIASVTKTFVAASVLRLVEQKKVRLDAPIARYLSPRTNRILRDGGYRPREITVRQLLRHTSGLFDYAATEEYDTINVRDPGHRWTPEEQLRFAMDHGEPIAEPGEQFSYSDTGYVLLGEIIERATGRSLPAAVRRLVGFHRLGLDHTYWETLEPAPAGEPPRAHQYYGDEFDNAGLDASHDLYGGGGLVSTVGDLTRFYRALFHGKVFDDERTLRRMLAVPAASRRTGAGMGIFRVVVDGERCYGHPGYWGTETIHCPRLDVTFARSINQADDSDFDSGPLEAVVADLARRADDD
jgi:D-alanyl-D-alanine carboxypeptidase